MKFTLHRFAFCAACLWAAAAHADCVDGVREPTAAETDFHRRAIAALIAALPPVPAGAGIDGTPQDKRQPSIGVLCKGPDGHKVGALDLNVSQNYIFRAREAQSEAQEMDFHKQRGLIDDDIHALLKLPPAMAAERDALERKARAVEDSRQAAMKAGDKAAAEARLAEINSLNGTAWAIRDQHQAAVKPQVVALQERRKAYTVEDQRAAVRLALNVVKLPPASATPSGNSLAGAWGAPSPTLSAGFKVNNVVWSVGGPETALRQALAEAINKAWLQGLLGKPLPTPEQSQAMALKAAAAAPAALAAPVGTMGTLTPASSPATATAPTPAPTPAPATAPPPVPAPAPAAADAVKNAADAVLKLRGLFGR